MRIDSPGAVLRSRYFLVGAGAKVRLPATASTLDKTGEILNDILFVSSQIDKRLFKKQILVHKWKFSS